MGKEAKWMCWRKIVAIRYYHSKTKKLIYTAGNQGGMEPTAGKTPRHIAVILDGNRRFSRQLMLKPWKGHEWGAKKVEKLLDWCREIGIKELTLYAFSWENFNRPKEEFNYLMKVFNEEFGKLLSDERVHRHRLRVNFIGRIWRFPEELQEKMRKLMEMTKGYDGYIVNFAMAYGGRAEVVDAAVKIATAVKEGRMKIEEINEESFSDNLYMKDEPELIIRTGGAQRTSNFLPWQSAYSELVFIEKLWPEFEKEDLIAAVAEYSRRERRFGR
jgi:tritrans,polycis-undecaprenyl-diphosphate synthase [geranylgeranyl-diphosphate specific]